MTKTPIVINDPEGSRDNEVRPFSIDEMDVRGRAVRLGTVVDQILRAHDYPDPVAKILGELLVLTAMLGSAMKYEGIVTLQSKSDGPIPMMVADFASNGAGGGVLRGYTEIDQVKLSHYGKNPSFGGLVGNKSGYLALTIDQGEDMERYQGIVDLKGTSLSDVARNYFTDSEQTPTEISLNCGRDPISGHWRAGGIMVQHLARGEEGQERILERDTAEEWERARVLMLSVKTEELVDPQLDLDQLLFRLYHEDGVRVYDASRMEKGCRCSREKLETTLKGFSAEDIDHAVKDGKIEANCQFCNTTYEFDPADFK